MFDRAFLHGDPMSKIGRRECYLIKISSQNVERLAEQVNSALAEMGIPDECSVNVYKNFFTCCGFSPGNIIIEVTGPSEEKIKAIDLKAVSKILEICEKGKIDHHVFGPLEIT